MNILRTKNPLAIHPAAAEPGPAVNSSGLALAQCICKALIKGYSLQYHFAIRSVIIYLIVYDFA